MSSTPWRLVSQWAMGPEEHEDLLEEFVVVAEAIVDITSAQDVVNKVFD